MEKFNNHIKQYILIFFTINLLSIVFTNTAQAQSYTVVGSATSSSSGCVGPAFLLQSSCGNSIVACCVSPNANQPSIGSTYTWNGSTLVSGGSFQNLSIVTGSPCPCILNGVSLTASPTTVSAGGSTTLTASPSGSGYSYSWSGVSGSGSSVTASPSVSTNYTVTVTNQNCSGSASVQVNVNTGCSLIANAFASPSLISQGGSTTLSVTASGGTPPYTYLWSNGNTNASQTVSPSATTNYNVTVTDNTGCKAYTMATCSVQPTGCGSFSVDISGVSASPSIPLGSSTHLSAIASGGSGNYTTLWSHGLGTSAGVTVSPTTTTTYSVTVTDPSNNCSATDNITVNVFNCTLTASASSTPSFIYANQSATLTATASGGTSPYSYIWSDGLGSGSTKTVSPTATKTYNVTVYDANGLVCEKVIPVTVTVNDCSFTATATSNPTSVNSGGSATLNIAVVGGSGNYSYVWSNGGTTASQTVFPTATTTYFATVTDNVSNCKVKTSATVSTGTCPPIYISASSNPTSILPGGSATLNVSASGGSGGFTYRWSNGATTSSQTVTPTTTTTYTVTATDASGCSNTSFVTISIGGCGLSVAASSNPSSIASGATATLTATATGQIGTVSYAWSNGATGATITVNPTATTTYQVTATEISGCSATASVTVNTSTGSNCASTGFHVVVNTLPSTIAANNPVDLIAAAANGSGNYTYTWGNGLGTGANKTAYPTTTTTYYVTATDNVSGCIATGWAIVNVSGVSTPCYLNASISANAYTIPLGGNSILTPSASGGSGNYEYMWWGWGSYTTPTPRTVVPNSTTTYELRVYDLNNQGCFADARVTVAVCSLAVSASSTPSVINYGESTTLSASASGGSGVYTYTWSNGFVGQTQTVSPTSPTTNYTVTVTSSNGTCGNAAVTTVTVLGSPCGSFTASISPSPMSFSGQTQLNASATGGSGSYTYAWSNGLTGSQPYVLPSTTTTYTVTVTDNSINCVSTASITIPAGGSACSGTGLNAGTIQLAPSSPFAGQLVNINNLVTPSGGTTSGGGYYEYLFQVLSSSAGITNWTDIGPKSINSSSSYTPPVAGTYYIRRCVQITCGNMTQTGFWQCAQVMFTVNACDNVTNAGTITGAQTNCDGYDPTTITSTAVATGGTAGGGAVTYQWQMSSNGTSWVDIPGATSESYDPPNVITGTTHYRRGARRGVCPFIYTTAVIKTVTNYSNGGSIASNESLCGAYNPALISSVSLPSGGTGGTPQYQWQISTDNVNWTDIAGATAATYDPPSNITVTSYYRRASKRSTCTGWLYSNVVTKAVVNNITDAGTIGSNATTCSSVAQIPITEITPVSGGNDGVITYSWQSSTNGGSTWTTISGATNADYTPPAITVTTQYRRGVRRSPCTTIIYSNIVTRTVITNITNAGTISGPETSCDAFNPAEIVSVTAPSGGTGTVNDIVYQWQMSLNGSTWTDIVGATSANFDPGFIATTTHYRRGARAGTCTNILYTASVIKTVNNYTSGGTISGNQSLCSAYDPTLIASSTLPSGGSGGTAEYQWQLSTDFINWTTIAGATATTYDPPPSISVTTYYRRGAKRSTCTNWVYSNAITKEVVNNVTDGGSIGFDENVCSGGIPSTMLEIATPTGGSGGAFQYIWQQSTNGGSTWTNISGATNVSFTPTTAITATTHYRRGVLRGACTGYVFSNVIIKSVVTTVTNAGTIAGAETGCSPFSPALITSTAAASGGTGNNTDIYYQWQSSPNGTTWTDIVGANSETYLPSAITATTHYRRGARRLPCSGMVYTTAIIKTVSGSNITNAGTIASNESNCGSYDPALITETVAASGGSGTIQYVWEQSIDGGITWTLISGATATTFNPSIITQTTWYRRGAKQSTCAAFAYSNIVTKDVTTNVRSGGTLIWEEIGCAGYNPMEIREASTPIRGTSIGTIQYIWEQHTGNGWSVISGATGINYDPPVIAQTTRYRRGARHTGCTSDYIYSNVVTKQVINNLTSGGTIASNESNCGSYDPSVMTETAAASGGFGGVIEYLWEESTNGGTTWTPISGAINPFYDPPTITQTTQYRRAAKRFPCEGYVYSNIITKSVNASIPVSAVANQTTICNGNSVSLTASGGTNYTWSNGLGNGATVTATPTTTTTYTVTVTDANGCSGTAQVIVTVNSNFTDGGTIGINQSNCSSYDPSVMTETVAPSGGSGGTAEYIWEQSINGGSTWTVISGATAATYDPSNITQTTQYRRGVRNSLCPNGYVYSNIITKSVNSFANALVCESQINGGLWQTLTNCTMSVCEGQSLTLSVTPNNMTTYQWSGPNNFSATGNAEGDVLVSNNITAAMLGTYTVTVTDANGCSSTTQITLTPCCNVSSVTITGNQAICAGETPTTLTTSTTPTGSGTLSYQWQQSTTDCNTGFSNIAGATNISYTPSNISQTTYFRLVVTNTQSSNTCNSTSNCVTITYVPPPSVTVTVSASEIMRGTTSTLTANVSGATLPITYQWQFSLNQIDWTNIPNSNNATYTTPTLSANTYYRVQISQNGVNCPIVTSTAAFIRIAFGSVGNYVWADANSNGINDEPASAGLNGIRVELWSVALNQLVAETFTASVNGNPGYYNFIIFDSGNYFVKFPINHGSRALTTQTTTAATDNNSDANPTTGQSPIFTIDVLGQGVAKHNPTIDAGFKCNLIAAVNISGGNLSCTVSSVTLTATPNNGVTYLWNNGSTTVSQNVNTEGVYTVTVTDVANACTATASATVSQDAVAFIGNYVWADVNGDGYNNEPSSAGINGLTVELWDNNANTLVATATTANLNGNPGYYQFCVATSGDYYVKFPITNTTGKRLTTQNANPGVDNNSDADFNTGKSPVFTINVNGVGIQKNNMTIDAGYQVGCTTCVPLTITKTN